MAAAIYNLKDGAVFEDGDDIPTINGSRHSASAKHDFIARADEPSREDQLVFAHHGNMPAWAQDDPSLYWRSAEEHERANARLFKEVEFELPMELTPAQREELVVRYAKKLAAVDKPRGKLPFTAGIHAGIDKNPCVHMMFSERVNDGHARTPELWFRRAATGINKTAADGGAKKIQLKDGWFANAGKLWADMTNEALAAAGRQARKVNRNSSQQEKVEEPQSLPAAPPETVEKVSDALAEAQAGYEELRQEREREDAIEASLPPAAAPAPTPAPTPAPVAAPIRPPAPAPTATLAPAPTMPADTQDSRKPTSKLKPALIGGGVLALLAAAVAIGWPRSPAPAPAAPAAQSVAQAPTPALPLPESGQGVLYAPWAPNAIVDPFVVEAPPVGTRHPDRHYFVTASDWNTGSPVLSIFVRAGESGRTVLPKGSYRITIAEGTQWYGPQKLFGPQTATTDVAQPVAGGTLRIADVIPR